MCAHPIVSTERTRAPVHLNRGSRRVLTAGSEVLELGVLLVLAREDGAQELLVAVDAVLVGLGLLELREDALVLADVLAVS